MCVYFQSIQSVPEHVFVPLTFANSPLFFFKKMNVLDFLFLTSSHALLPTPSFSLFAPLFFFQDETVGKVSLALAGGLPCCLGDALG